MTRYYADDGNCEMEFEADTGADAAQEYVDGGDWGDGELLTATAWIRVRVADADTVDEYRDADDDDDVDEPDWDWHTVGVDPDEPDCTDGEHDWQSPLAIVGGIAENPGVWGHGGGVTISECCMRCGCRRLTDTWAQDPSTGEQGLCSVEYEPGYYDDALSATEGE